MSGAVRLSVPGLFRQSRFAEADGNRTRLRALALTPVLKFVEDHVGGCGLMLFRAAPFRSASTFVPSGAAL